MVGWKFWEKETKGLVTIYDVTSLSFANGNNVLYLKTEEAFGDFVYRSGATAVFEYDGFRYVFSDIGIVGVKLEK